MLKPKTDNRAEKIAALERRRYRAECKVRCLEANLDRIDPREFDLLMEQLEAAQEDAKAACLALCALQVQNARCP